MKNNGSTSLYAAFDIGSTSVKAAVIEVTAAGKRLIKVDEEILKKSSDFAGEEEYLSSVSEALKTASARINAEKCKSISALFSNRELQVKVIELPSQIRQDQIEQVIGYEAKKLLNPAMQEEPFVFAYKILRSNPYLAAISVVPARIIEEFIKLYEASGLELSGVYGEVFAADAIKDAINIENQNAVSVINFGSQGTHLQVFSGGLLRFYRYIPSGLAEMSLNPQNDELEMYAQKIRFSFDYFRAVSKLNQIDSLYFMGGGVVPDAVLPFAADYFAPSKVGIADISSGVDISPMISESNDVSESIELKQRLLMPFFPAVGAALASLAKQNETTNLLAFVKKQRHLKQMQRLTKALPIVIIALGALLSLIIIFVMRGNTAIKIEEALKKKALIQKLHNKNSRSLSALKAAKQYRMALSPEGEKIVKPITEAKIFLHDVLRLAATKAPKGVSVDEILIRTIDEMKEIALPAEGEALNEQTGEKINEFKSKLSQNEKNESDCGEELVGKGLLILGSADNNTALSAYVKNLSSCGLCECYGVLSRKKGGSVEFIIKGALP